MKWQPLVRPAQAGLWPLTLPGDIQQLEGSGIWRSKRLRFFSQLKACLIGNDRLTNQSSKPLPIPLSKVMTSSELFLPTFAYPKVFFGNF